MAPKVLVISSYAGSKVAVRPEAEMVLQLKQAGIDLDVMTPPRGPYIGRFQEAGIHIHPYKPERKFSLKEIRHIRSILRQGQYDIVHVFNNRAVVNTVMASLGLPVRIMTYRGYTGHLVWYKPTAHLGHLNPRVRRITCVSQGVEKQVRRQLLFHKDRAVTVYKGHDPGWYGEVEPYRREQFGIPDDAFVVGCVANARPMKGIPYLIKASHQLQGDSNIHFMLIGRNMDTPEHMKLIGQSPLRKNFHLLGHQNDVLNHLSICDALALPSIRGEGLSKVTVEAMSTGLPVIATSIGGNPELVINKQTGMLVQPKSPGQIAEAIRFLRNHPEKKKQMGVAARRHIANNFHINHTVQQMKALYEEVAQG